MPSARYPHTAKVGVSYYCIVQITGPDVAPSTAGRMGDRLARKGLIRPPEPSGQLEQALPGGPEDDH